jgi:hypothetical protein
MMFRLGANTLAALLASSVLASAASDPVSVIQPVPDGKPVFTTFDPSGSTGTDPLAIDIGGSISGEFADSSSVLHGFVRSAPGTLTTFDAPGAGTSAHFGTFASSMNSTGAICGTAIAPGGSVGISAVAYLRTSDGTFTNINPKGAVGAYAYGINAKGLVTGTADTGKGEVGFLRRSNGKSATFSVSGALATEGLRINSVGTIVGEYFLPSAGASGVVYHGFVRAADGTIAKFDPSGIGTKPFQGTFVLGISSGGTIAGYYVDANYLAHGFVRAPAGAITTFEISGAGTTEGKGTFVSSISDTGIVVGYYVGSNGVAHGFERAPKGKVTAIVETGATGGTLPEAINDHGVITGTAGATVGFSLAENAYPWTVTYGHGFVRSR